MTDKPKWLLDIESEEAASCKSFAKWRTGQGYDIRTSKERDLLDYVNALHSEIADLRAEVRVLKGGYE